MILARQSSRGPCSFSFLFFNLALFLCCTGVSFFMGYDLLQSKLGGPLGFLKSLRSTWPQGLLCSKFLEETEA